MSNVITQIQTIMTKNPLHVAYVKGWLGKYAGVPVGNQNSVFTDLYNAYFYFVNSQGFPFPIIDMSTGGMDSKTVLLRDNIVGMSAIVPEIVNQFLYAIYTGYVQSKLSRDFAFPRDPSAVTPTQASADTAGMDAIKKTASTTSKGAAAIKKAITWIPTTWSVPAEVKSTMNPLLSYGIVAALAAGAVWYFSQNRSE